MYKIYRNVRNLTVMAEVKFYETSNYFASFRDIVL